MASPEQPKKRRGSRVVTVFLVALTVLGVAAFAGSVGLAMWLYDKSGGVAKVHEGTWLLAKLEGQITDAPIQGGMFLEPDDFPPVVTEIAEAIRAAGTDERISGLVLSFDNPAIGLGGYAEIRDAVEDFRAAGKPCVAYSEMYTTGSYYLASACDTVLMAPSGLSLVSGMALSVTYYAELFDKIGIEAEYEHVGDFKTAVEPFERTEPSEAAKESYEYLLDGIWPHVVGAMAEGRGKTVEQMQALVDDMQLTPSAAVERGLIDGVAFPDAIAANIQSYGDDGWLASLDEPTEDLERDAWNRRFTMLKDYLKSLRKKSRHADARIAVIHAEGPIVSGDGDSGIFGGTTLTDGAFRDWMREAREADNVVAVVVRVNSPGGSGLASDMMWREIERTKAQGLPVVVSQADYAASGGYFISAPADWIVAHPTTITGSIGVFGGKLNIGGTYEKIGLHQHTYQRGDRADFFSATHRFDDGERDAFRAYLSEFYDHFLGRVAQGRGLSVDQVHEVAQGRVWTGEQALERGLVDAIGGLDDAIDKAAELASVEEYGVVRLPERKGFFDLLLEDLADGQAMAPVEVSVDLPLPGADDALEEALLLQTILADGAAAYLPGQPTLR